MYVWKAFDDPLLAATFGRAGATERALGEEMSARWAAFIHGDAPDAPGKAVWPVFDGKALLVFDDCSSRTGTVDIAEMDTWKDVHFGP